MGLIAVFGGTFNPFHIGHYKMLSYLCKQENIEIVLVMPDKLPPHKTCDFLAKDEDRIEMCRLVCKEFKKAKLCLVEFEREGKSYTFDTISVLKQRYPESEFAVVCGGDMIATLDLWYKWEDLLREVSFIAFCRSGNFNFSDQVERMRNKGARISVAGVKIPDVSSTQLRRNIDKNLLPKCVYDYLNGKDIYNG